MTLLTADAGAGRRGGPSGATRRNLLSWSRLLWMVRESGSGPASGTTRLAWH